jgi:hypothetical protein
MMTLDFEAGRHCFGNDGFKVASAITGQRALNQIEQNCPAIVVELAAGICTG